MGKVFALKEPHPLRCCDITKPDAGFACRWVDGSRQVGGGRYGKVNGVFVALLMPGS